MPTDWSIAHLEVVIVTLIAVVTAILVLQDRRSPQSAMAWLMALILLPYLAVPAFLLLGYRKRRRLRTTLLAYGASVSDRQQDGPANSIEAFLRRYGQPEATDANHFVLTSDPSQALKDLMGVVQGARRRLDLTFYALNDDQIGRDFVAALRARALAGVQVRLILDSFGAFRRPRKALRDLVAAGGEVRLYSRLLHGPFSERINLRNHRKMVINDAGQVFAGGRNVGRAYLGESDGAWADLSFVVSGPASATFERVFASDWAAVGGKGGGAMSPGPESGEAGASVVQPFAAGPDVARDPLHDLLIWACHRAQTRIWIATPYFLPTPSLMEALTVAANRGIDLRIVVPARSNQLVTDLARGSYLRELQASGAQVLLAPPPMLHAKALVIDQTALVGSANIDVRSLLLNYEMTVVLHSPPDVAAMVAWMEAQFARATLRLTQAGRFGRLAERLLRLASPML